MIAPFHNSVPSAPHFGKLREVDVPLTLSRFIEVVKTVPQSQRKDLNLLSQALIENCITSDLPGHIEEAMKVELNAVGNQLKALRHKGSGGTTPHVSPTNMARNDSEPLQSVTIPTHAPSPTGKHGLFVTA
jgi:hypothetical protein